MKRQLLLALAILFSPAVADDVLAVPLRSAPALSDAELSAARGGFFTAAGAQFDFGASIQTLVNGQLALQTNINWTQSGATVQQLSGLGASIQSQVSDSLAKAGIGTPVSSGTMAAQAGAAPAAGSSVAQSSAPVTVATVTNVISPTGTAPALLSGVDIKNASGGSTQILSNLSPVQLQNIVVNSASNQTITQNTNLVLTIYNFADWQKQIAQNAVSAQLAGEIMAASGLGGSR